MSSSDGGTGSQRCPLNGAGVVSLNVDSFKKTCSGGPVHVGSCDARQVFFSDCSGGGGDVSCYEALVDVEKQRETMH
jgi:hypothetical protein